VETIRKHYGDDGFSKAVRRAVQIVSDGIAKKDEIAA